ncbi:MAG: hypothetical protein ACI9L9_002272, partial [Marivirga sp.]
MRKRFFLVFLTSCLATNLLAQRSLKAFKALEDADLSKALGIVEKGLEKHPGDPANAFVLAKIYSLKGFREELIDSAHRYILSADTSFINLPQKYKKRYERRGMDRLEIDRLHAIVDSLAFYQIKSINTASAYNGYLLLYGNSSYLVEAIALRNKVAYQDALGAQTPEALSSFFELYPNAPQATEARAVFENLYYQKFTKAKTQQNYIDYLQERPNTLFAEKAATNLLKIISSQFDSSQLKQFSIDYAPYSAAKNARQFLDYFELSAADWKLLSHYNEGLYHFFNFNENLFEALTLPSVETDSCKWINQPIFRIVLDESELILNNKGDTLFNGNLQSYELFDRHWLKVKQQGVYLNNLVHLSASMRLRYEALDFKFIDAFTFAEKQADGWWLKTFTGHSLLAHAVDSIWKENDLFFFNKESKFAVATREILKQNSLLEKNALPFLYSDYEIISDSVIWLASDEYETLVDTALNPLIDLNKAKIIQAGNYYLLQKENETVIYNENFIPFWSGSIQSYKGKAANLAVKQKGKWAMQDWREHPIPKFRYDSLRLFNHWLAFASDSNSQYLIFGNHSLVSFNDKSSFQLLNAYDLAAKERALVKFVVLTNEQGLKTIYDKRGEVIWEGEAVQIKVVSSELLFVKTDKNQFLLHVNKERFLLENVQAIGNYEQGAIPILNKSKFGVYISSNKQIIAPQSDSKMAAFV